jgi:hypothetical protein
MSNPLILYKRDFSDITQVSYQTNPNIPVERVSDYYTIPHNLQETWSQEIAKVSEDSRKLNKYYILEDSIDSELQTNGRIANMYSGSQANS